MTNPTWWQALVETALLGTERKSFDQTQLPVELQLVKADTSPEQALLQTVALAGNYVRAGNEPAAIAIPDIAICEPETKSYASAIALRVLAKILDESTPNRRLLGFWLSRCTELGWLIPPDKLPALFNLFAKPLYSDIRPGLRTVMGNRGNWLIPFNPDWHYLLTPDPEVVWQEGKSIERVSAFGQMRQEYPFRALSLLQKSWATESAKDRTTWVKLLVTNPIPEDIPFAETILVELDSTKKPNAAHRDLRAQTVALLLDRPESALFVQTQDTLSRYITVKRELLINKIKVLSLPDRPDAFFNDKTMASYGFESDPALSDANQVRQWFYQFLSCMHPSCWTTLFGIADDQLISQLKRQSWFEGEGMLYFSQPVIRHQLVGIARELISSVPASQRTQLLAILPQHIREDRLMGTDELAKNADAYSYLIAVDAPVWSADFSEWIIQEMMQLMRQHYQLYPNQRQFLADSVLVIHPGTRLGHLAEAMSRNETAYQQYQQTTIQNQILGPLTRWLDLRRRINEF
ncbi:hypothetical protein GCM10028805_64820 [Spirosoma harenae]